jgi:hypothetical protein
MDSETFDRLVQLLGQPGSRRAALGTVLASVFGTVTGNVAAKGNGKSKRHGTHHKKDGGQQRSHAKSKRGKSHGGEAGKGAPASGSGLSAQGATCNKPGRTRTWTGATTRDKISPART